MHLDKTLAREFKEIEHYISEKDCMLYALGLGLGTGEADLQFVYEKGLKVFPCQSVVISHPGPWPMEKELGIDWVKILHGEQSFTIYKPLEPEQTYVGSYKILGVVDKGPEKGALLYLEKILRHKDTGDKVSRVTSTYFLRGDGGCGGTDFEAPVLETVPDGAPDMSVEIPTLVQAGLIYRLSGDRNPIHADPELAVKAGFDRPILHGLCTMGVATRALLDACCDNQPERLKHVGLRFSAPVYPGETIRVDIWRRGDGEYSFEATAKERNKLVLSHGYAKV